jgi:hypothetical protein
VTTSSPQICRQFRPEGSAPSLHIHWWRPKIASVLHTGVESLLWTTRRWATNYRRRVSSSSFHDELILTSKPSLFADNANGRKDTESQQGFTIGSSSSELPPVTQPPTLQPLKGSMTSVRWPTRQWRNGASNGAACLYQSARPPCERASGRRLPRVIIMPMCSQTSITFADRSSTSQHQAAGFDLHSASSIQ